MLNLRTSDNQKIACREWKGNHRCCCYCSVPKSCLTLWDPMDCSTPGFPVLHYLLEFAQIHVHWVSDANLLILSCPILLLPSVFPRIRVFSSELVLHIKWPKYWSFNISPSNEYSGTISFRIEWFNLLVVQETYLPVKKSEFYGEDGNLFPNCQWFTCLRDRSSIWILLAMVAFFSLALCVHTWWLDTQPSVRT